MATFYSTFVKRPLDCAVAMVSLSVAAPAIAAISAAIKLDSPGPILFSQTRIGMQGEAFEIYKFRSMRVVADSFTPDGLPMSNAERVTRVGKFLRRTSLDELPQLLNVLRGDMSIVGPRPALPYQVERYTDRHRRRLAVRPGITGLAQVSGRNSLAWDEKIVLDLEYCRTTSFRGDLRILSRTLSAVLSPHGQEFTRHDALSDHGSVNYIDHI